MFSVGDLYVNVVKFIVDENSYGRINVARVKLKMATAKNDNVFFFFNIKTCNM